MRVRVRVRVPMVMMVVKRRSRQRIRRHCIVPVRWFENAGLFRSAERRGRGREFATTGAPMLQGLSVVEHQRLTSSNGRVVAFASIGGVRLV